MRKEIVESVKGWLYRQAESEIEENLVEMMILAMEEPLLTSLPEDEAFAMIPPMARPMVKQQIVSAVKAQTLVSLRSLINANRENSKINQLIVQKYFPQEKQVEGLAHVDKYSAAYAEEVESFYRKINASNFDDVVAFN